MAFNDVVVRLGVHGVNSGRRSEYRLKQEPVERVDQLFVCLKPARGHVSGVRQRPEGRSTDANHDFHFHPNLPVM
jgi:hypothetical protein